MEHKNWLGKIVRSPGFWTLIALLTIPFNWYLMTEAQSYRDRAQELFDEANHIHDQSCRSFSDDNLEESDQDVLHI